MPQLDDLWKRADQSTFEIIAQMTDLHLMKPYDQSNLDNLLGYLGEYGYPEFVDYACPPPTRSTDTARAAELLSFLKAKVHKPKLDTTSQRSETLEIRYLSGRAPSGEAVRRLERSLDRAREILPIVIQVLESAEQQGPNERVREVLTFHFRFTSLEPDFVKANLPRVLQFYRSIQRGLAARVRLSDAMGRHKQEAGYVNRRPVEPGKLVAASVPPGHDTHATEGGGVVVMGNIHVTFEKFLKQKSQLNHTPLRKTGLAGLIIHEASHKFCDTKDNAYVYEEGKYASMTTAQATDNADSYAYAALSLYCRKLIKDKESDGLTYK